jgi:futalosine hydrolase
VGRHRPGDQLNLLLVTAVPAEAEACRQSPATVVVGGVGPVAAAAATATALARDSYDVVLSVGIGGGFPGTDVGGIAVASQVSFADLGAETGSGFTPLPALGFGRVDYPVDSALCADLAVRTAGRVGTVLTVATVTGTAATAADLTRRYPDAVAEGMEGAGVAEAADRAGVRFGEVRAVSNLVGPRDRAAWRIEEALTALAGAVRAIGDLG